MECGGKAPRGGDTAFRFFSRPALRLRTLTWMPAPPRSAILRRLPALFAVPALCLSSCGVPSSPLPDVPTVPMDAALDTAGEGMFYAGTARIPRRFSSPTPFEIEFDLSRWGSPPGNEASARATAALSGGFPGRATFEPLGDGRGRIPLLDGRLQLRGKILTEGKEFAGDWFFDNQPGGSFRIVEKGIIFL